MSAAAASEESNSNVPAVEDLEAGKAETDDHKTEIISAAGEEAQNVVNNKSKNKDRRKMFVAATIIVVVIIISTVLTLTLSINNNSNSSSNETNNNKSWPKLMGISCEEAKEIIQREDSLLTRVVCLPEGSIVTKDFREDRVWIYTNDDGNVVVVPKIG